MSEHKVSLRWKLETQDFRYPTYNRDHTWTFDGGVQVQASAAPAYLGNSQLVDPEEAFMASISSCHMLTFLAIACKKRLRVEAYADDAVGFMEKNEVGRLAITRAELHPVITFGGDVRPTKEQIHEMHELAHGECFIANSVKTIVTVVQ